MTPLAAEILTHLRTEHGSLTLKELEADAEVQQGGGRWPAGKVIEAIAELVACGRAKRDGEWVSWVVERQTPQGVLFAP